MKFSKVQFPKHLDKALSLYLLYKFLDKSPQKKDLFFSITGVLTSLKLPTKYRGKVLALSIFNLLRDDYRKLFVTYFALKKIMPRQFSRNQVLLYTISGCLLYYIGLTYPRKVQKGTFAFLTKHLQIKNFDEFKKKLTEGNTTCQALHPESTCKTRCLAIFKDCFKNFLRLFMALHLTSSIMSNRPLNLKTYIKDVLQSSLFLSSAFTSAQIGICFWNRLNLKSLNIFRLSLLWSCVGPNLLLESSKRRTSVSLFYLANVFYPLVDKFDLDQLLFGII